MKKTMFITSVIMVVVMAIALTTSSLAWFSASGSSDVTTDTLKISATAGGNTGILIGRAGTAGDKSTISSWDLQTSLSTAGQSGLMPLLPYKADATASRTTAQKKADLIESLSAVGNTGLPAPVFYGDKIDGNNNFTNSATNATAYSTGYYVDTVYIKNAATGFDQQGNLNPAVAVSAAISFKFGDAVDSLQDYTVVNRGTNAYDLDAALYVAVLAPIGEFTEETNDDGWEILAIACSKVGSDVTGYTRTPETVVRISKDSSYFETLDSAAACFDTVAFTDVKEAKTSDNLRPDREENGLTTAGDIKTIVIVAWYDATTLNNNNSQNAKIWFNVQFSQQQANNS